MSKCLPRSNPESQGVDPAAVTKFIDEIEAAKLELHSFMLLRHGNVAAEGWWKPYAPEPPHMLFSLSKSFTSTAVGFAVSEGLLTVDDPVLKFFPDEAPEKPGKHWEEMKVRHLLSMSTGHAKDTTGLMTNRKDGDWAKGFLLQPLKYRPGAHFFYNTGATYMLSVIVQKLTGRRALDYLTPRLFEPLGIEGAAWEQCPKGYDTGGFGLSVKTEDIAKFGQFLLQRGMWEGRQLLPAAWIDEATRKQVDNGPADGTNDWGEGYGYQFWRCIPGCYRGDGAFGQYCIVAPQLDAVVAITGGLGDMGAVMRRVWDILLPAMKDAVPENPQARKAMRDRLAGLQYGPPALRAGSPLEAEISGKTYALANSPDRRKAVRYVFSGDSCEMHIASARGRIPNAHGGGFSKGGVSKFVLGRGEWIEGMADTPKGPALCAASFSWEDDRKLVLTLRLLNTPFVIQETVKFESDSIELSQKINVGFGPTETPAIKGVLKGSTASPVRRSR
jgi:CubicO group peptidase (beta-lactamase class C family)